MTTKVLKSRKNRDGTGRIFVVATSPKYQQLCVNSLRRLTSPRGVKLVSLPKTGNLDGTEPQTTLLVTRLADISKSALKRAHVGAATRQLVFLEGLPVEAVAARLLPLNIRNPERVHLAAQRDASSIEALIYRILSGMTESSGSHPIVDAWIENQRLVILSPTFSRLEVALEKLTRFIGSNESQAAAFEIDEDGRFLYWPHCDVHLGWTQFEQIIDPAKIVTANEKTLKYNRKYGEAIRATRESAGLKQSDIRGITDRQLRRVEHGQQTASKATLEALAAAHSLSLADYVEQLAKRAAKID